MKLDFLRDSILVDLAGNSLVNKDTEYSLHERVEYLEESEADFILNLSYGVISSLFIHFGLSYLYKFVLGGALEQTWLLMGLL